MFEPAWVRESKARFATILADRNEPVLEGVTTSLLERLVLGPFTYRVNAYHASLEEADRLAFHSAAIINAFARDRIAGGKQVAVIIHPSKEEIYFPREKATDLGYDFDFPRKRLVEYLDADLPLLDLTEVMRGAVTAGEDAMYYPLDGHYTPTGYRVAAEGIANWIARHRGLLSR